MFTFARTLAIGGLCLTVGIATAVNWTFDDPLDGSQEVPPVNTDAFGTAFGTYNSTTNALNITVQATDFSSGVIGAHIHFGPPGTNGGVVFDLGIDSNQDWEYFTVNNFVLSGSQEVDFLAGNWYVNIHTDIHEAGEIRGQLNPVPEPATILALAAGSALLLRRRKKA